MADITLYHFASSHFNEKARWTLDLKGVPHERVSLMPGPHGPKVKKLTGATQVPVLVDGGQVVPGSAAIIDHLERKFPKSSLYPNDAVEHERALEIQRQFDDEVGPAVRLAKFFEVLSADYVTWTFCREKPAVVRTLYKAAFPLISLVMKGKMGINAENAERACGRTQQAFDFVAKESAATGYLVGARPKMQQTGQLLATWLGPIVIMALIFILHEAYGLGSDRLPAPQGQALASTIQGILGGDVPVQKYAAGAGLGALLSASGVGGLGVLVGLGFYLPFNIVLTYSIGTVLRLISDWKLGIRWSEEVGIPVAAGLIVGEALVGVGFALYYVTAGGVG